MCLLSIRPLWHVNSLIKFDRPNRVCSNDLCCCLFLDPQSAFLLQFLFLFLGHVLFLWTMVGILIEGQISFFLLLFQIFCEVNGIRSSGKPQMWDQRVICTSSCTWVFLAVDNNLCESYSAYLIEIFSLVASSACGLCCVYRFIIWFSCHLDSS